LSDAAIFSCDASFVIDLRQTGRPFATLSFSIRPSGDAA
jgi:hypothetical protein